MPTATPASLTLTDHQKEILGQVEAIDLTKLHFVNNSAIEPGLPVDAYTSGHYLIFVEGVQDQHVKFYQKMYATQTIPELTIKVPGLWVYETPSAKFTKPEMKVTVN
jgi:hypothetical protein